MCISLAIHHNFIRGWVSGEQTKSILPNTVTTATLHLHNKQKTQMALDSKLS